MPRYFFHVHNGHSIIDEVGTELRSLEVARNEAVNLAGKLLKDDRGEFWKDAEWHLDVTNDTGLMLFSLHFMAVDAPALSGRPADLTQGRTCPVR